MKYLLTLLVLTGCAWSLRAQTNVRILSQTSEETILQVDFADIVLMMAETPQGMAYTVVSDKCTPILEAGAPDIPKLTIPLMIPQKGGMAVEILDQKTATLPNVVIAPSKGNLMRTVNPADVPYSYGEAYSHNSNYPVAIASLQAPFIFRDARGQSLWVSPVQYNPVTQTLIHYESLKIRVYKNTDAGENEGTSQSTRAESRAFTGIYKKLFANYNKNLLSVDNSTIQPEKITRWKPHFRRSMGQYCSIPFQ